MRPDRIVMASPLLDQHLGFSERCEDFHVQQLVSEFRVEALAIAVLPRTSWLYVKRLDTDPSKPASHVLRDELRPIVGTNMVRRAVFDEEISETVHHIVRTQSSCDDNRH